VLEVPLIGLLRELQRFVFTMERKSSPMAKE